MSLITLQQVSDKNPKQIPGITYENAVANSLCIKCYNAVRLEEFENPWSQNEYLLTAKCKDCQPKW